MRNEQGFSFVESILTVSIIFLLFGSLIPFTNHMKLQLEEKRIALHIAITKNQASTSIKNGHLFGEVILNDVKYSWEWNFPTLCVKYIFFEESNESCEAY
ncbi:hypothetical protein [Paenisporosarcina sp. TG20]|uniref:hypothetical protein n=1 Tax=Paenisporosarcina sp. TG20 TaxID=1211706 RepID=UPI0002FB7C51|nr:hypothetical protein [Paenisporosarcina sp. TG20]